MAANRPLTRRVTRSWTSSIQPRVNRPQLRAVSVAALLALGAGTVGSSAHAVVIAATPFAHASGVKLPTNLPTLSPNALPQLSCASSCSGNIASSGNTTAAYTQSGNTSLLTLTQGSDRAIVNFNTFDIGLNGAVQVNMPAVTSAALYRVLSGNATQIEGSLKSNGEIFLINQNGILFGAKAQVNTNGLFASALNIDNNDFLSGLNNSITGSLPTFFYGSSNTATNFSTYFPSNSFVMVEQGAQLTTASGGRVFLLGAQVENDGLISTPNGQTVLAAGNAVYLSNPASGSTPLYMSEANANVPTVRGLLVEVNGYDKAGDTSSSATNGATGTISTPTGNTTIVGWAVNQDGRINATTSISENGSVYLLARSGTTVTNNGATVDKYATAGGSLTLGGSSAISITPDATLNADGSVPTQAANSEFTASRIELSGRYIDMQSGAAIVAPGAVVNARASLAPIYTAAQLQQNGNTETNSDASITVESGATIDVSGTTDTSVSVARNFVTTALLGNVDLADSPLQKTDVVFHNKLTFDIREPNLILGDTSSYTNAILKSADEFMSGGGAVTLYSTHSVVTQAGSTINVSGGAVNYSGAYVQPSILVAADGSRYTFNEAPADLVYTSVVGQEAATANRFGSQSAGVSTTVGQYEAGYTSGQAAGTLAVYAPKLSMDGALSAHTTVGSRQRAGLDAQAALGTLIIGATVNGASAGNQVAISAAGANPSFTAITNTLEIGDQLSSDTSHLSASALNDSGFGNITIAANGKVTLDATVQLSLPQQAKVTIDAAGVGATVTDYGQVSSAGGSVALNAYGGASGTNVPLVHLYAGSNIDVSGDFVNQYLDGLTVAAPMAGGNVAVHSDGGLITDQGSAIKVNGGLLVARTTGTVTGTAAGSVTLDALQDAQEVGSSAKAPVRLNGSLQGYGMGSGGSLAIVAGDITVNPNAHGLSQSLSGNTASGLVVGGDFFSEGGFSSFSLDGRNSLTVLAGSIAPVTQSLLLQGNARLASTGTAVSQLTTVGQRVNVLPTPVNISLSSTGLQAGQGQLKWLAGAKLSDAAQSTIALKASGALDVEGQIASAGGTIDLTLDSTGASNGSSSLITLGSAAVLDVSGTTLLTPNGNNLLIGSVLGGGSVNLQVSDTAASSDAGIFLAKGSLIRADGAVGTLDVQTPASNAALVGGYRRESVASNGGSISIETGNGGGVLEGTLSAQAGNATATGGYLKVGLATSTGFDTAGNRTTSPTSTDKLATATHVLTIQDGADVSTTVSSDALILSTQTVADGGFANATIASLDVINFAAGVSGKNGASTVTLSLPQSLTLDAPVISASQDAKHLVSSVNLFGGSTLTIGSSINPSQQKALSASNGATTLNMRGGLVVWDGQQTLQGVGQVNVYSQSELRLEGYSGSNSATLSGGLNAQADIDIHAQQVDATTGTAYAINDQGSGTSAYTVTIEPGDSTAAVQLSALASITINADNIDQFGVLRAPFGQITLNATKQLTLGAGSLTSVSGDGLTVPYGYTTGGGATWTYNSQTVSGVDGKSIELDSPSQTVAAGATLDLGGGGTVDGLEFVPGPGGKTDIFSGSVNGAFAIVPTVTSYSPTDASILASGSGVSQAASAGNKFTLGETITFAAGGPVPAGTYAILPASYALLYSNAYLVKPTAKTLNVAQGYASINTDGSYTVGATVGVANVGVAANSLAQAFVVMTSKQAQTYSQFNQTSLDSYLTNQATIQGSANPALMRDAGHLSLIASSLVLAGNVNFSHGSDGLGGTLDISSSNIHVGNVGDAQSGALNLTYAELNQVGADSVLLGGTRGSVNSDGSSTVTVNSQNVTVDAVSGQTLSVGDLVLAANDSVVVGDGTAIVASGSASAHTLAFTGDGALLRVSADATASTVRTGTSVSQGALPTQGALSIGAGVHITGASVDAEASLGTRFDSSFGSSGQISAKHLTLGASGVQFGGSSSTASAQGALFASTDLIQQLNAIEQVTLRSYGSLDVYTNSTLGGASSASVTLDTASIVLHQGANLAVTAGSVNLQNSSGSTAGAPSGGAGTLTLTATGANGADGHVSVLSGAVTVSGAQTTQINAAGSMVMQGASSLSVAGNLAVQAQSLTATTGANASIQASGSVTLSPVGTKAVSAAASGLGAQLSIAAQSIQQNGLINLSSGVLNLSAQGDIGFGQGSSTNVAGAQTQIDGVAVATVGGQLNASAGLGGSGNINMAQGSVMDASAGLGASSAGSVSLSAANGSVSLLGQLLATNTSTQTGGSLSIDAKTATDLGQLASSLSLPSTSTAAGNFSAAISVRNRTGDQTLAAGSSLSSQNLTLSSDAGNLSIYGGLNANGGTGGNINLNAARTITVGAGAVLSAQATTAGQAGGNISLEADSSTGAINLSGGSIQLGALSGGGGKNGVLTLSTEQVALSGGKTGVNVANVQSAITGASAIKVVGVKTYNYAPDDGTASTVTVTDDEVAGIAQDASSFVSKFSAASLFSSQPALAKLVTVQAGAVVNSAGDLYISSDGLSNGWAIDATATQAPLNLTLRAAGNLYIEAPISVGLSDVTPTATAVASGGSLRLIGGADLKAANVLTTTASTTGGDVLIGTADDATSDAVTVRTTTGAIQIAAGRDINLLNENATVYTTGLPVALASAAGYLVATNEGQFGVNQSKTLSSFLYGGGNISLQAQRDVIWGGSSNQQFVTDWYYRQLYSPSSAVTPQMSWWSRYDLFGQGVATFGGGNISIAAGQDVVNMNAEAVDSGYSTSTGTVNFGGGSVSIVAGRDVVGGVVMASQNINVQAGGSVIGNLNSTQAGDPQFQGATLTPLQVVYGDGSTTILGRESLDVGNFTVWGMIDPTGENGSNLLSPVGNSATLTELGYLYPSMRSASVVATSTAGDFNFEDVSITAGGGPTYANVTQVNAAQQGVTLLPSQASFESAAGNVILGLPIAQSAGSETLVQAPGDHNSLNILAAQSVTLNADVVQMGSGAQASVPVFSGLPAYEVGSGGAAYFYVPDVMGLPAVGYDATRIVAQDGSANVAYLKLITPLRLIAGLDINQTSSSESSFQNDSVTDVSFIEAGRDWTFPTASLGSGFNIDGPGNVVVDVGRDLNLQTSSGLVLRGNRQNTYLPAGSANLTLVAGVSLAEGDVTQAVAWGYPLLGGLGVAADPSLLLAQLQAVQSEAQTLTAQGVGITSAAGQAALADAALAATTSATSKLSPAALLQQAIGLAGEAAYEKAVAAYENQSQDTTPSLSVSSNTLSTAQALSAFQTASTSGQMTVAGQLLAQVWTQTVPASAQVASIATLAASDSASAARAASMAAFVNAQGGAVTATNLDQVIAAFAALSPEVQQVYVMQALNADVGQAIANASVLSGAARDAAYQPAYQAIETVFPVATAQTSTIDMGDSQIKSEQNSSIYIANPNGGIDVGRSVASASGKTAGDLGLVTADGGNIGLIVRDDVTVDTSRVFTLVHGDETIWSSLGSVDAGLGAKTVTSTPTPVYYIDATGHIQVDVTSAIAGSGITATGTALIGAPKGEINSGDAGISAQTLFLAATVVRGLDNISAAHISGEPAPAATNVAVSAPTTTTPPAAGPSNADEQDSNNKHKRRKRNVLLDFLGFGS